MANATGHKSCNTFKLQNQPAVADDQRINIKTEGRQLQAAISRRAFDLDGIIGSNNGAHYDGWYFYNGRKAINFAYFSSWYVTAVSGNTVTLTVINPEDPEADAKIVIHAAWRDVVQPYGWYVNGYADYTAVQPGDMLEFQWPSVACNQLKAKILQVTGATQTTLTVVLDKAVDSCTSFYPVDDPANPGEFLPDPEYPSVKVYQYGREAEQWMFVQEPQFLYGARRQKELLLANVPDDGIWILENAIIAPPDNPLDPLTPFFVVEGWDATLEQPQWITIGQESSRLHIKPGYSAYSLKTTLPEGSIRGELTTDLTTLYTKFRATYYVETTQRDSACRIVGMTCFHHRKDYTASVSNYGTTKGVTGNKYCSERVYEEYHPVDEIDRSVNPPVEGSDGIPERVTVTLHHPTGIDNFPVTETATCIQYGFCNKYENALHKLGDRNAGFNVDYTMQFLRELWFASDKARRQKYILSTGYDVERIMHPSIMWLNDVYGGYITPHAWRAHSMMRGNGTWFPCKPAEIEDANGNISLVNVNGFERGYLLEYDPGTDTWSTDHSREGNLPANVTGYKTKRNPFIPGATVSDSLLEYIGCQIERDTGVIADSRGLHQISMALGQESIVAPNFDVTSYDLQTTTRTTFQRDSVTGDATVTILPYRQDDKAERNIGSRTIYSVTNIGTNTYEIEFENESKTFSKINIGEVGIPDSYNEIFTVMAGGGPCILPYEPQALSSYEGDKNTGSRACGAMPLDCIDINGDRFVILTVTPHGGSEASTWGSRQLNFKGDIGGFFEVTVGNDEDGNPLLPIEVISVKNITDTTDMVVLSDEEKPDLLLDQCWFDRVNRFYFNASLNNGDYIEVKFKDRDEVEHTQYQNVQATFVVTTEVDYSEYTGATVKNVYIGNDLATVVEGGGLDPAPGEVRFDNVSNKIVMTFNTVDAPKQWRINLQFAVDAPAPQDDWAVGGDYLSFGKKRDVVTVIADGYNGTDYFAENNVVGETAQFYQSATVFLPKTLSSVYYTEQGTDDWKLIADQYVTPNAASGKIVIDDAFFQLFNGADGSDPLYWNLSQNQMCFRIADIQMVDNRGQVPHSILQKTKDTIDSMQWCLTSMGGGKGNYSYGEAIEQAWYLGCSYDPDTDEYDCSDPLDSEVPHKAPTTAGPSNHLYIQAGCMATETDYQSASMRVNSTAFGMPQLIANLPDGVTIEEAWAEVNSSGITKSVQTIITLMDCDGDKSPTPDPPDTSLTGLEYTVIGFSGPDDFTVIGSVAASNPNKRDVVNITDIVKTMYESRNSSDYAYGFGVVFSPGGFNEGATGVEAFFPSSPPGYASYGPCPGFDRPGFYFTERINTNIEWGNLNFGQVAIRINYNGKDKTDIIQSRFPAMTDLPPAA